MSKRAGNAGGPPDLSLWKAAQVLADDPSLTAEFERTAKEHPKGAVSGASFADAYARERERSRYRLSDAVPIVDALAAVAGDDGVLQGDEWKKLGPKFSPLGLQIAEKAKTAKPASGSAIKPVINGISAATRAAITATSENLVGVDQMPVLKALADELAAKKPLAGTRIFAVQHLFASSFGLFEALERSGANVKQSQVFGKSYSTNTEVMRALQDRGWTVEEDYSAFAADVEAGEMKGVESPLLAGLGAALKSAAAAKPPERLLLLDEGGKLNRMLHDVYPEYAHLCRVVEQTTNGLQNMEGTKLLAPAVSVADSQLKREVEGPIIGEDVAVTTLDALIKIDPKLVEDKTVGIVGFGAVGSATAAAFAARGFKVIVTDIDPKAEEKAKRAGKALGEGEGSIEVRPRAEVLGAGIVVGCTGRGCMSEAETRHVSDGAILVSAASGDHEFPVVRSRAAKLQGARSKPMPMKEWQAFVDRTHDELATRARRPIVTTSVESGESAIVSLRGDEGSDSFRFPTSSGPISLKVMDDLKGELSSFFLRQGDRKFVVLRGGTPINMDRDLPPKDIQLTRSMLYAACVQAMRESAPGWKVFDEAQQHRIEAHWRREQES
ncbi:MAG: adenosylhomocysteinase [Deltaproteobacteria bacterium]|nr:adenosylhomocysteinase [Deltaproteobacteria bacterium]